MGPWEKFGGAAEEAGPWSKFGGADLSKAAAEKVAAEVGPVEAAMIAMGRTFDKGRAGVRQGWNTMVDDKETLGKLASEQAEASEIMAPLEAKRPIATGIGGALPYAAIPASWGMAGGMAASAGLGALQYGSAEERAKRAGLDAATFGVGSMIGKGVSGLISPVTQKAAGEANRTALDAGQRIGVQPRLSHVTGSPLVARIEDFAARIPGGAGVMQKFANTNQTAVNRAAAGAIGETADELTPGVFSAAAQRLGKVFNDIKTLPGKPIGIGAQVGSTADDILRQTGKMLDGQRDETLVKLATQAKALAQNRARIDGETYQLVRSGLSQASYDATGTNKTLYGKLLDALDSSAEQSLKGAGHAALADALKSARPQYANLKLLERGTVAEAGQVSPARVASALRTQNPAAFREGRTAGPLADVARVGEGMKPLQAGSPTFERAVMSSPLTAGLLAGPAWLAAHGVTSPAVTGYARNIGSVPGVPAAAQLADPASRAAIMGVLGRVLGPSFGVLSPQAAQQ